MTDREKVIKGLEHCGQPTVCDGCPYDSEVGGCFTKLKEDALALLKEQEPKPVKVTKNSYNYEFYDCPNCGRGFELTYYKKPAYCDKCGQAVKWDATD